MAAFGAFNAYEFLNTALSLFTALLLGTLIGAASSVVPHELGAVIPALEKAPGVEHATWAARASD